MFERPQNPTIDEFYVVQIRQSADFLGSKICEMFGRAREGRDVQKTRSGKRELYAFG